MLTAGVARVEITPYWGVELTGWGYDLNRTWRTRWRPGLISPWDGVSIRPTNPREPRALVII